MVSIWRVKKGEDIHDYNYKMESNGIDFLSDILTNSKLKKSTINDSPSVSYTHLIDRTLVINYMWNWYINNISNLMLKVLIYEIITFIFII